MNLSTSRSILSALNLSAAAFLAIFVTSGCSDPEQQSATTLSDLGFEANSAEDFHRAAAEGASDAIALYLEYGMDVDSPNLAGLTPLMSAVDNGQANAVKQLIDLGADVEAQSSEGRTPLLIAASAGETDIARLLLGREAEFNVRDREGWNALTLAAFNGHSTTVELLASKPGKEGLDEALLVACFRGEAETISTLLTNGAYVNSRSPANQTPLMIAAQSGHLSAVRALIKGGANPYSLDNDGKTSADLAEANGYTDVTDYLLDPEGLMFAGTEMNEAESASHPSGKVLDPSLSDAKPIDGAVIEAKASNTDALTADASSPNPAPVETAAFNSLALESFREEPLPIMFKGIKDGEAKVRVLSRPGSEPVVVNRGDQIEGTHYRVVDYRQKFISGKGGGPISPLEQPAEDNEEESIDVSEVIVQNLETGEEHELVKDIAGQSNASYAVLTTPDNSERYIVHPNDRFTTKDNVNGEVEYEVLDIRPTQVVVQDLATLDVFTIARDGLVVMNVEEEEE